MRRIKYCNQMLPRGTFSKYFFYASVVICVFNVWMIFNRNKTSTQANQESDKGGVKKDGNVSMLSVLSKLPVWTNQSFVGAVKKEDSLKAEVISNETKIEEKLLTPEKSSSHVLFQNISKWGKGDLFQELENETFLSGSESFFQAKQDVRNSLNYSLLIDGKEICKDEEVFLLFIIPAVVEERSVRDLIRTSWLSETSRTSKPNSIIKHAFIFGGKKTRWQEIIKELKAESDLYGDIIMASFEDSYQNLTTKVLTGFQWATRFCNRARFVFKVDMDTFINVPLLVDLMDHVTQTHKGQKFVVGRRHLRPKPNVVRQGKWAVSEEEYPMEYFPGYMLGHTYGISMPAVHELLSMAHNVRLIGPEDVFITGILPRCAKIARLSALSFPSTNKRNFYCDIVWNKFVGVTDLTLKTHISLWSRVKNLTCNEDEDIESIYHLIVQREKEREKERERKILENEK